MRGHGAHRVERQLRAGGVDPNEVIVKLSPTGSLCVFVLSDVHLLVDVVGWATTLTVRAAPAGPARRHPGRAADGRQAVLGHRHRRRRHVVEIQVTGRGGVAAGAAAAVVNLTVTGATGPGYATHTRAAATCRQRRASTQRRPDVPNEVVAKLSPTGTVCVFSLTDDDLIVDVVGYVPTGAVYTTLTPARLADTRAGATDRRRAVRRRRARRRRHQSYEIQVTGRATSRHRDRRRAEPHRHRRDRTRVRDRVPVRRDRADRVGINYGGRHHPTERDHREAVTTGKMCVFARTTPT